MRAALAPNTRWLLWAPGDTALLAADADGLLTVRSATSGEIVAEHWLPGHAAHLACSADGSTLATAHPDRVLGWDLPRLLGR